jgi:hypothetical protein
MLLRMECISRKRGNNEKGIVAYRGAICGGLSFSRGVMGTVSNLMAWGRYRRRDGVYYGKVGAYKLGLVFERQK